MRSETRHSIVLIAGTGTTALLSLVYAVYVGRLLEPADYAHFTAAVSFVYLCSVAMGPINPTVARFTAKYASHGAYGKIRTLYREITRRVAIYGLLCAAAALLVIGPLANILRFPSPWPLAVAYGMVYLTMLLSVARGVLRGIHGFGQYNVNVVLEALFRLLVGVVLLQFARAVVPGLLAYLIALVAVVVMSQFQLRGIWADHPPERVDGSEIRRFAPPMFLLAIGTAGFQNIDMLMVKHFAQATDAGCYGAAATLARSMIVLVTPFNILLLPLLTALHEQNRPMTGTLLRVIARYILIAALPLLVFGLWARPLIIRLYGEPFAPAAGVLLPLAAALGLWCLSALIAMSFISAGRFRFLYVYLGGLVLEILGLIVRHDSLQTVVTVVFVAHAATAAAMAFLFVLTVGRHTSGTGTLRDRLPSGETHHASL